MIGTKRRVLVLVAGLAGLTTPAAAASLSVANGFRVQPTMTYTSAAAISSGLTGGSYTGVGSLFVTVASTATTGLGYLCTGALLSSNVVLTAGHCLSGVDEATGAPDPVTAVSFFLPSRADATPATTFQASSWTVSPTYNNDVTQGGDYALFTLSQAATGFDTYSLYQGDPLQQFTRVGTGTVGGPTGTDATITDYNHQRTGTNLFEYTGDLVTGWSGNILLSDFDDGTAQHDAFGRLLGIGQTGIPGESNSSPGDSGGPEFINGQIVSVTSFGITGDAFRATPLCGLPGSIDPYGAGGTTGAAANMAGCTNSSVGEISGDTWLLPYQADINAYVTTAAAQISGVPEPATWMEMIAGIGLVGIGLRRRRPVVA